MCIMERYPHSHNDFFSLVQRFLSHDDFFSHENFSHIDYSPDDFFYNDFSHNLTLKWFYAIATNSHDDFNSHGKVSGTNILPCLFILLLCILN